MERLGYSDDVRMAREILEPKLFSGLLRFGLTKYSPLFVERSTTTLTQVANMQVANLTDLGIDSKNATRLINYAKQELDQTPLDQPLHDLIKELTSKNIELTQENYRLTTELAAVTRELAATKEAWGLEVRVNSVARAIDAVQRDVTQLQADFLKSTMETELDDNIRH